MMCNYCDGDEAIFWANDKNNAFVDSKGEMMVTIDGHEIKFQVDRCPKCGRMFNGANCPNMRKMY